MPTIDARQQQRASRRRPLSSASSASSGTVFSDISDESDENVEIASAVRFPLPPARAISVGSLAAALPKIPDTPNVKDNTPRVKDNEWTHSGGDSKWTYSARVQNYDDPGRLPDCLREYRSDSNSELDPLHSCIYCTHLVEMAQRMQQFDLRTIKLMLLFNFPPWRLQVDIKQIWDNDSMCELEGEHQVNLDYRFPKMLYLDKLYRDQCEYWYFGGGFGGHTFFTFDEERVLLKWLGTLTPNAIKLLKDVRMVYFATVDRRGVPNTFNGVVQAQHMKSARQEKLIQVLMERGQRNFALNCLRVELHVTDVTYATNSAERAACEVEKLVFGAEHLDFGPQHLFPERPRDLRHSDPYYRRERRSARKRL